MAHEMAGATLSDDTTLLRLLERGEALAASEIAGALGVSQPTLSRRLRGLGAEVVVMGRARATRYGRRRRVRGLPDALPLYELRPGGPPRRLATLQAVGAEAWWVEAEADGATSALYPGLPWPMQGLRLSGFLGRAAAAQVSPEDFPRRVSLWSGDDTLRFQARYGWDAMGAFVVGDDAMVEVMRRAEVDVAVPADGRERAWLERARRVPSIGWVDGPSPNGEVPKFAATRSGPGGEPVPVIVKYSPPAEDGAAAVRAADLLIAEHHALGTLAAHGQAASASALVFADGRAFLELVRFDRPGPLQRRGFVELAAIDAALVGSDLGRGARWTDATGALARLGVVQPGDHARARWLHRFGELIGNDDMHFGNLSFFLDGFKVGGLTPAYDMLPMAWSPARGDLNDRPLDPPHAPSDGGEIEGGVITAAEDFWQRVAADARVSDRFRRIASGSGEALAVARRRAGWLPR